MSRKQGPRAAGMRPSAIAASRRCDVPENFPVFMRGDGMSRKQGPRAVGMRPPVHVVRVRLSPGDMNSPGHCLLEVYHGH